MRDRLKVFPLPFGVKVLYFGDMKILMADKDQTQLQRAKVEIEKAGHTMVPVVSFRQLHRVMDEEHGIHAIFISQRFGNAHQKSARADRQPGRGGLHSRHRKNTAETVDAIRENGGKAFPLIADISRYPDMERVRDEIEAGYGLLDLLFANAGVNGTWAPLDELTPEEFDKTIQINLNGTFHTIKAMYPVEFPEGQIPLTHGRPGDPEDCAEVVYFLGSPAAKHITGANIYVDGAQSLLQG
ncbi:MAG: SDR family oxidoreductase [Verrucomicrobia bacterium]|nr:SDR family oxidoreductase [Verrucomicrobiota bacterium]MCH8529200.1 SDR family oxidoreductase [Kiritimatiellia bacterium]